MMKNIVLQVKGMTCAGCAGSIGNALKRSPGVSEAKADFASGKLSVSFDEGKTDEKTIKHIVNELGYKA